jgi:hypothetical protein
MSRRNIKPLTLEEEEERNIYVGTGVTLFTPYVRRLLIAGFLFWLTTYNSQLTAYFDKTKLPDDRVNSILYTIYGIIGSIVTYEFVKWFAD